MGPEYPRRPLKDNDSDANRPHLIGEQLDRIHTFVMPSYPILWGRREHGCAVDAAVAGGTIFKHRPDFETEGMGASGQGAHTYVHTALPGFQSCRWQPFTVEHETYVKTHLARRRGVESEIAKYQLDSPTARCE